MRRAAWIGLAVGAAVAGTAIAVASRRRRGLGEIKHREYAHPAIKDELEDAERRARAAGAGDRELTYIGAGAEGITFCDDAGKAYKVGRHDPEEMSLLPEAEWLKMASTIPSIKQYIPRGVRFDEENNVIVRECLTAREGVDYLGRDRLRKHHERLAAAMKPYGYGQPEFKNDSWVYTRRGPVLVDAGFAIRRGQPLVKRVLDVINGRRKMRNSDLPSLAWEVRMERGETIPEPVANKLLRRLKAMNPDVEL